MTEVEAKMFEVKVFKNLRVEDPSDQVVSTDGVVLPAIWRRSVGVVTPSPKLPLARRLKKIALEDEAKVTMDVVAPATPSTVRLAVGVDDPIPSLSLILSKKKLALSCDTSPPAPMNGTEPAVKPER